MKILRLKFKDASSYKEHIMAIKQKFKAASIGFIATTIVCMSIPVTYASDIEIYKVPEDAVGSTTLMMMLDLSGSMGTGSINVDYGTGSCTIGSDATTTNYTRYYCAVAANTTNTRVTNQTTGCEKQSNNTYRCYDRITRLKDGLSQALTGTTRVSRVDDKIILGLSTFAGNNGYIRVPARPLSEVLGTYQVQVTKTRTVYDTVPIYETQQEQYEVTPAIPAYNRPYWQRKTTTLLNTTYRYRTCNWNSTTRSCTWPSWGTNTTAPTGFTTSKKTRACTSSSVTDYNCVEYYDEIPATAAVIGTRPIQVQVGTQQVPRQETYQDWETRNTTQRDLLLSTIQNLAAGGGTPTAYAYAEAAAYLMGTQIKLRDDLQAYFLLSGNNAGYYKVCNAWNGANCTSWDGFYYESGFNPTGYTKGASGTLDGYNGNYYIGSSIFTGFNSSVSQSKSGNYYVAPTSITEQANNVAKKECSGQGIYFLTDGEPGASGTAPNASGTSGTAYELMSTTLGNKGSAFNCANSPLGNRGGYASALNSWTCIGKYAQALLDPAKNPANVKIRTSVVGFGSSFGGGTTVNNDVEDAKSWGTIGDGGWIAGSKPEDVSKSINDFVGQLNKDIPSMSTGSSTIPIDALNPAAVQPYSYFPQFEPKVRPEDTQQIWFGNLKKYYVLNNSVYSSQTASDDTVVVKKSKLQDLADIWAKGGVTYPENTPIFKKGGALSQLPLGTSTNAQGQTTTARNLLTDYNYDGTKAESERVNRDFDLVRINYTYTSNDKTKTDTTYANALMSLLGYNIPSDTNTNGLDLSTQTATIRQMGSIMHSNPVLITQTGKAVASKNSDGKISVGTQSREDYVLFGTTQGLVQVVDASTGVEKFAFVPKEIIERQSETFKNNGGNLAGGKEALYYGMDGEWTAHTVYVTKSDGTLTVKGTARNIADSDEQENLSGKQWVYGGMRMGGRSYYALDLTDIDSPKIKFHIDPSTGKVYSKAYPSGKAFAAIANMGQSWSKPTLSYINWKGQRKLVMFVGGGYDAGGINGDGLYSNGIRTGYAGYEIYNYKQEDSTSTNKTIGSGVYMFDADTGDLLWNADSANNSDLKYSVASQIRAIDRNNDGITDHLYFGDLAGQGFRVDFQNDGSETFLAQATKILNLHQTDGTSPRFYTLPVFTAHRSVGRTEGGNIVMATFVSGNKSSPLLATSDSPQKKDPSGLQFDGAYAVYDYDVYPDNSYYPTTNIAARTLGAINSTTADITKLKYINGASTGALINQQTGWGGWYYLFNKKFNTNDANPSVIKALTNPIALEGSLYITQFDSADNGTTSSCGAGVKGNSFAQRLCLPTGVCSEDANYKYNLGSGIVTLNVGGSDTNAYQRTLVVPDKNDICTGTNCSPCTGSACNQSKPFLTTGGSLKLIPNRWYEKYARQSGS